MGCFLGCFGSSKDPKRRKIPPARNPNFGNQYKPIHPNVAAKQETLETSPPPTVAEKRATLEKPITIVPESRVKTEEKQFSSIEQGKTEEQLSSGSHKRVTFDSNVKEYEHISVDKVPGFTQESEKEAENGINENFEKPSKSPTVSDGGSTLSSLSSYPPNHRYQNYRESDDEECEDLDSDLSDLDNGENELDEDEEEEQVYGDEYHYDDYHSSGFKELSAGSCPSMESRTNKSPTESISPEKETKTQRFSRGARVLSPVENTTQWKAMKAKAIPPLKHQKENFPIDSKRLTSNLDEPNSSKSNHEIAVNASLSAWLVSSEKTPPKNATPIGLEPIASGASASSYGSNSVKSHEERPILGALTMEELKDFSSSSSSPRRSPARSPDEKPLVGTVGVHWNSGTPIGDSSSASSFKGIPNTTSKYREDKRVKWHSTPFETRLERALNKGAAEAK